LATFTLSKIKKLTFTIQNNFISDILMKFQSQTIYNSHQIRANWSRTNK